MVFVTLAPDTGSFGAPGYQVPVVVPQVKPEEPEIKIEKPVKEPQNNRNKKQGDKIQGYLNGDDEYRKSHQSSYTRSKRQLAEENRFLVINIATGFLGKGLSLDDLVGEGNLGLMRSVEDYNPKFEFSTYAAYWIKQSIIRALHTELRANLPIPYHICSNRKRIMQLESVMEKEFGRKPTDEEIAHRFNETYYPDGPNNAHISGYHVEGLKIAVNTPKSIILRNQDGDEDEITVSSYPNPEEIVTLKEELEKVRRIYLDLDEREKTIISLYYGLDGNESHSYGEIGNILGCTRQNIAHHYNKALKKLRSAMDPEKELEEEAA